MLYVTNIPITRTNKKGWRLNEFRYDIIIIYVAVIENIFQVSFIKKKLDC